MQRWTSGGAPASAEEPDTLIRGLTPLRLRCSSGLVAQRPRRPSRANSSGQGSGSGDSRQPCAVVGDRGNSGRTGRMHRTSAVRMMSGRLTFESDFAAIVRLLPQLGYARDNGVEGGSRTKECRMISPKISRQEWPVMEELWRRERLSIREIHCTDDGLSAGSQRCGTKGREDPESPRL